MGDEKVRSGKGGNKGRAEAGAGPISKRALAWTVRVWRPVGSVVAVGLALLVTWHVINGKHGLNVWQQNRLEDHQLQREIKDLDQENTRLRDHIARLKSDPDAIEHEAREKLHYAKAGEVIYTLPAGTQAQPAVTGK